MKTAAYKKSEDYKKLFFQYMAIWILAGVVLQFIGIQVDLHLNGNWLNSIPEENVFWSRHFETIIYMRNPILFFLLAIGIMTVMGLIYWFIDND